MQKKKSNNFQTNHKPDLAQEILYKKIGRIFHTNENKILSLRTQMTADDSENFHNLHNLKCVEIHSSEYNMLHSIDSQNR